MKERLIIWALSTLLTRDNFEYVVDAIIDMIEDYAAKHKKPKYAKAAATARNLLAIPDND